MSIESILWGYDRNSNLFELGGRFSNFFLIQNYTANVTVRAENTDSGTFSFKIPSGYEIASVTLAQGSAYAFAEMSSIQSGTFRVRNFAKEAKTFTYNANVLLVKK